VLAEGGKWQTPSPIKPLETRSMGEGAGKGLLAEPSGVWDARGLEKPPDWEIPPAVAAAAAATGAAAAAGAPVLGAH